MLSDESNKYIIIYDALFRVFGPKLCTMDAFPSIKLCDHWDMRFAFQVSCLNVAFLIYDI